MQPRADFELIIKQRREFSYSKYRTHIQNVYSPENYRLIKVLSSMPLKGLEKAYEKKKQNFIQLIKKRPSQRLPELSVRESSSHIEESDCIDQDEEGHSKYHIKRPEDVDRDLHLRPESMSPHKIRIVTERERNERHKVHDHLKLYFEGKIPLYKEQIQSENQRSVFQGKNYYNQHYNNVNKGMQVA